MKIRTPKELASAFHLSDVARIEWLQSGLEMVQWRQERIPRDGTWFLALVRTDNGAIYRTKCHAKDGEWMNDDDNQLWVVAGWAPLP